MLEVIKDKQENIKACIEFYVVDENGRLNDKGLYCWINDAYVSRSAQNNGCLKYFVKRIIFLYPQLQFCYFWREKYKDKNKKWRIRLYSKRQWLQLIGGANEKTNKEII